MGLQMVHAISGLTLDGLLLAFCGVALCHSIYAVSVVEAVLFATFPGWAAFYYWGRVLLVEPWRACLL